MILCSNLICIHFKHKWLTSMQLHLCNILIYTQYYMQLWQGDGRELSLEPNLLQKDVPTCSIEWYLSNTITLQGWHKAITISDWYSIPKTWALLLWLFYTFLPFIYHEFTSKNVSFLYPWFNRKCAFKWSLMMMFYTVVIYCWLKAITICLCCSPNIEYLVPIIKFYRKQLDCLWLTLKIWFKQMLAFQNRARDYTNICCLSFHALYFI